MALSPEEKRERQLEAKRRYNARNKEKHAEYLKKWKIENPEKIAEYQKRHREKYPEQRKEWDRKYKAKTRHGIIIDLEKERKEKLQLQIDRYNGENKKLCSKMKKEHNEYDWDSAKAKLVRKFGVKNIPAPLIEMKLHLMKIKRETKK